MDISDYLSQLGGVARTRQLLAAGYTRTDIVKLAGTGAKQPRRGVFMLADYKPEIAAAIRHNARVTCASAASHYGLWLRDAPLQHHLACNHGHGRGFVRHRTNRFEGDPTLPLAALEDVVLHSLACLPPPASTAMATSAMRLHGVPLELLKSQLLGDRSGPSRAVLHQLDLRAESIVEVDAQHLFRLNGLNFEIQVQLPGIGRVDFLIEGCLIVEVDGYAFHSSRAAMRKDLNRNNASTLHGYSVLRYMPEVIWFEPERVIAEIRTVLDNRRKNP
jgi:very-short-patch-repair endonuclease